MRSTPLLADGTFRSNLVTLYFLINSVVIYITIGVGGLGFDSRASQINRTQCRQRLALAATFLWSCGAVALSRRDGLRHSLHAST